MKPALLAEDDPASRAFLSEALQLLGWQCEAFETGTAAAQAAIARRFEVLLLDFNLPDGDGIQYLRMIRNLDSHASSDSPALALTADDDAQLHARLRNNGFDAVATKPLSIEQLGQVLAGLGLNPAGADYKDGSRISEAGHGDSGYRAGEVAAAWEDLPLWDDAAGLATVGNNPAILSSLRELMLRDLPG
ncbi:MAG: response regulator, partial [Gammaproteobacteria bacterium]|nr:response regulator [Gammaproteobacteria bacterium]